MNQPQRDLLDLLPDSGSLAPVDRKWRYRSWGELKATRRHRWWHEMLAEFLIARPTATLRELAEHFGRTENTISLIRNSDTFKAYLLKRRQEISMETNHRLMSKTMEIAEVSADLMLDSMRKKRDSIPLETLKDVHDSALTRLGYGAKPAGGATVQVNVNNGNVQTRPTAELFAEAQDLVRDFEARQSPPPQRVLPSPAPEVTLPGHHDPEATIIEGEVIE